MFLARIDGTLTSTAKHETLAGGRFLIGRRLESNGEASGEPLIIMDAMGAPRGAVVLVTTDGDVLREARGSTTPASLSVAGLVDRVAGALA